MNNTKKILSALCLLVSLNTVSFAQEETSPISANITIANEYVWRGQGQSINEDATIQAGLDYANKNGFAIGIWGSNVDSEPVKGVEGVAYAAATGTGTAYVGTVTAVTAVTAVNADIEVDIYASYSGEINDFGYEIGYIAYIYPSASVSDFEEAYIAGSHSGVDVAYYFGVGTANDYFEISYALPIEEADISILWGDYDKSHSLYGIGIGKSFRGLDFALNYTNTKLDDKTAGNGESNTVFSISKSF